MGTVIYLIETRQVPSIRPAKFAGSNFELIKQSWKRGGGGGGGGGGLRERLRCQERAQPAPSYGLRRQLSRKHSVSPADGFPPPFLSVDKLDDSTHSLTHPPTRPPTHPAPSGPSPLRLNRWLELTELLRWNEAGRHRSEPRISEALPVASGHLGSLPECEIPARRCRFQSIPMEGGRVGGREGRSGYFRQVLPVNWP